VLWSEINIYEIKAKYQHSFSCSKLSYEDSIFAFSPELLLQ